MRSLVLVLLAACAGKPTDTGTADTIDTIDTDPDDRDGDGFTEDDGDCDDDDSSIYPGAEEVWYDGVDADCNRRSDYDADEDGYVVDFHEDGTDCDDSDAAIHPDAEEVCDGADNNCDGIIDDDAVDLQAWYADTDGDGYGDPDTMVIACDPPSGHIADSTDCDDTLDAVHPGADTITCDGLDNDCDPKTTEAGRVQLDGATVDSIETALAQATAGSEITLCEGRYTENNLHASGPLTLSGLGPPEHTIIDAGKQPLLRAAGIVTLSNVTLTGGTGTVYGGHAVGGGVLVTEGSELTLREVVVTGNTAGDGAGVFVGEGAWLTLDTVQIHDNTGDDDETPVPNGGGIFADDGATLTFSATVIWDNHAGSGGGIGLSDDTTLDGGGTTTIHSNTADLNGGGIDAVPLDDAPVLVSGVSILNNEAVAGGGIYCRNLSLSDSELTANTGTISGGGVYAIGAFSAERVDFVSNVADFNGGAVFLSPGTDAALTDSVVTNNTADFASYGGGVFLDGGTLVSTDTDWGEDETDNAPNDIELDESEQLVDVDGVATFTCTDGDGSACAP